MKRSVQVEEALRGLNWGNFCLYILISTGGLDGYCARGLCGETTIGCMHDQLNTIFTYLEIK